MPRLTDGAENGDKTMFRGRTIYSALLTAALSVLSGCLTWEDILSRLPAAGHGSRDGGSAVTPDAGPRADAGAPAPDAMRPDPRAPFTPLTDVAFIDFFKPHHIMAMQVAEHEAAHGADPAVRRMASHMRDAQMREVEIMRRAREELTGTGEFPPVHDPTGEADMERLESLEGAALDRAFLVHMIPHHGDGLAPAHRAMMNLRRADLRALARSIYDQQSTEIGEMYAMLGRLTGDARAALGRESRAIDPARVQMPPDPRAPFTPTDDVRFTDFFIPHHEAAVMMADMVLARGADPEVRRLAGQIRDAQTREIEIMRVARRALGAAPEPPPIRDPHMDRGMATMRTLTGLALDRMFLEDMIPHHSAGLEPAHRAHPVLRRADLSQLATDIMATQAREIGEMHAMLDRLGGHH
jgi:uncharacterized protein (DUF305 family)